ncbi:MAG: hypothetical protein WCV83_01015 [Candidatus Magasanikbacteria bacterium]|jgi:hypothetical protein
MKMAKMCLAILVVVVSGLVVGGCNALFGYCAPGSTDPECLEYYGVDVDAANNNDGSNETSGGDVTADTVDTTPPPPTVEEVCKDKWFLQGATKVCNFGFEKKCVISMRISEDGECLIDCYPTFSSLRADSITVVDGSFTYDPPGDSGPFPCYDPK